MPQQKQVTFCSLSSKNRTAGRNKLHQKAKERVYDEPSCHKRRIDKIKKAANGCWWIEAYLMGELTYKPTFSGIDDE